MIFTNLSALPWLLAAFVALGGAAAFTYFRRESLLKKLLSPPVLNKLKESYVPLVRPLKVMLLITALALLGAALLDPRARSFSTDVRLQGIDLILVYDVSRSMDVKDISPSRLEAAKSAGEKLTDGLAGNRVGLVAFAAEAFRILPLTTDVDAVKLFLGDLNTELIGSQSTDIGKALEAAASSFAEDALTHKAVVLFTDGENLDGSPSRGVDALKKQGVNLFVVGAGTASGGPVPIIEGGREIGSMRDLIGAEIISKANLSAMQSLAKGADGSYYSLDQMPQIIQRIDLLQKTAFGAKAQSFLEPRFRIFALGAMLALLLFLFLPERKFFTVILALLLAQPLHALTDERRAYESYKKEDYPSALRFYQKSLLKNPKKPKAKFGESASLYKMERAERAESGFLGLTNEGSQKQRLSALYNAGNAQVQAGKMNEALQSYGEILKQLPPEDPLYKRAMNNYLYVLQQKNEQNQGGEGKQNPQDSRQKEKENQNNPQNQEGGQQKPQNTPQGGQGEGEEQQKDQTPAKPISPKEVENLLGVAQAEEKQNLKRQEGRKAKGILRQDKY